MRDEDEIKDIFEEKYEDALGMTYQDWVEQGPQNEAEAFARLNEIDDELDATYDEWYEATGSEKEELEDQRNRLKSEYELIEWTFGLENHDE